MKKPTNHSGKIRYAVVGLGHIAQNAVLPGFFHARKNSVLAALISEDPAKLRQLSKKYGVEDCFSYKDYDVCLRSGLIDAVYVALPNNLHLDYCVRAAKAGIHVLCEKPLAVTEDECQKIIKACAENKVKLMTAYRLHFERGNLEAVNLIRSGKIGEPRIFNSVFTMQVKSGNIRTQGEHAGGTLYDIGVYCINAARYLFADEPTEGFGYSATNDDPRFLGVEEMTGAMLRFPGQRLAGFTTSFGAGATSGFEVIGTKGRVRAVQAYDYALPVVLEVTVGGRMQKKTYGVRDQFGPEVFYFSDCIRRDRQPEPSGLEGLVDVHIIRSLYDSMKWNRPVKMKQLNRRRRPSMRQEIHRPAVAPPRLVHVSPPAE